MRKIILNEWASLDGVVQAPGTRDEDPSGGFSHGGWHLPYFDDMSREWVVEGMNRAEGFLFGRITYQNLAGYWPNASEEEQAIAEPLNSKPKWVVTSTLDEPLGWTNARVLGGDVHRAVDDLRGGGDGEIHVMGSSRLARALLANDQVDGLRLMIDPLILGKGKRLFPDEDVFRELELTDSHVTTTGALLATYTAMA